MICDVKDATVSRGFWAVLRYVGYRREYWVALNGRAENGLVETENANSILEGRDWDAELRLGAGLRAAACTCGVRFRPTG